MTERNREPLDAYGIQAAMKAFAYDQVTQKFPEHRSSVIAALEAYQDHTQPAAKSTTAPEPIELDGVEVILMRSDYDGALVVQVDTNGLPDTESVRINVNDGPIWDANPENHHHTRCECTKELNNGGA